MSTAGNYQPRDVEVEAEAVDFLYFFVSTRPLRRYATDIQFTLCSPYRSRIIAKPVARCKKSQKSMYYFIVKFRREISCLVTTIRLDTGMRQVPVKSAVTKSISITDQGVYNQNFSFKQRDLEIAIVY